MKKRKLVFLFTLLLSSVPLFGQATDNPLQVVFRFVEGKDMFYVPWKGNKAALDSLLDMVDVTKLTTGSVRVEGYSPTKALSKIRCNRVKSELIMRKGLVENHFRTTNYAGDFRGQPDIVIVTLPIKKEMVAQLPPEPPAFAGDTVLPPPLMEPREVLLEEKVTYVPGSGPRVVSEKEALCDCGILGIRVNLLRWATLTPDIGFECRVSPSVGILLHGSRTSWSWNDKRRRHALWEIMPEVRYYFGWAKRAYVGAMYKVGEFNYKLTSTAKQGDIRGCGITGGYQFPIAPSLSLDLSLALGYLNVDYERYYVEDNVRYRDGNGERDWWGPINVGVSLVWRPFK